MKRYFGKNGKTKSLYEIESHYVIRGQTVADEEYYDVNDAMLPVVTPALANEGNGKDKKYEKQTVTYSAERTGKKHISGLNFGQLSKITISIDPSVNLVELTHDSAPWPVYEKTRFIESELLDYSGWHELSEEALAKIPKSQRDKAKTESKTFKLG